MQRVKRIKFGSTILPETIDRIHEFSIRTHRTYGEVIDYMAENLPVDTKGIVSAEHQDPNPSCEKSADQ